MKLYTTLILSAVLLAVRPDSGASDHGPFGNGKLPDILKPFDVDGDGKLNAEERQAFVASVRAGERPDKGGNPWDTDGDGVLSPEEKAAAQEAIRARILAQRGDRFDELDSDEDGFLTVEELGEIPGIPEQAAARVLSHLDTDGDGKVSKEEFLDAIRPPRPTPPEVPPARG
jgi:hypothetical protein